MWISNVCSCLLQDRWQLAQGPTRELAGCLKPEKNEETKWHSVLSTFPPPFKQRRMETKVLGKTVAVLMALQEENTFEYHFLSKGHSTILSQKAKLPYLVSQSLRSPDRGLAALKPMTSKTWECRLTPHPRQLLSKGLIHQGLLYLVVHISVFNNYSSFCCGGFPD